MRTDERAQRRRDRMFAAALKDRVADVMTLGSVVAAASAAGSAQGEGGAGGPPRDSVWDENDCYFHAAISEGHWVALLIGAGLLNDTVGLNAARNLFVRHAVVMRVSRGGSRRVRGGL